MEAAPRVEQQRAAVEGQEAPPSTATGREGGASRLTAADSEGAAMASKLIELGLPLNELDSDASFSLCRVRCGRANLRRRVDG